MPVQSEELRRRLVADINAGTPGAKLGSERDLADKYGTSRSSLRQVLAALEEAGLVHRVIGRAGGIFISHGQVERNLSDVVGVPAFLANQGYVAGTRILSTRITTPDQTTRTALRLAPNDYVVEIQRVRLADGSRSPLSRRSFRPTSSRGCSNSSSADRSTRSSNRSTAWFPGGPTNASKPSTPRATRPPCSASNPRRRCC